MRLLLFLFRTGFYLLYHQFAWIYDLVAATVSLGRWRDWVHSALPYLSGRLLEIGYGPGHLQATLLAKGLPAFGLDESRQMARQAGRRLRKRGFAPGLARGIAQSLPFPAGVFDTAIATFPSEYIFDPQTLRELRRVLIADGKLVIISTAWITGGRPLERLAAWLFRVTGEAPGKPRMISAAMRDRFAHAGLTVRSELVSVRNSQVLVILASKTRY
jgi:ubiquinone/menaquinone biosynthesis C-methylase UbiE